MPIIGSHILFHNYLSLPISTSDQVTSKQEFRYFYALNDYYLPYTRVKNDNTDIQAYFRLVGLLLCKLTSLLLHLMHIVHYAVVLL